MTSVVIEDVSVMEVVLGGEAVMSGLPKECPHSRDGVSFPKPGPGWEGRGWREICRNQVS